MRLLARLFALMLGALPLAVEAQPVAWPQLPHQGFIRGRAATKADVSAGNAVFVASQDAVGEAIISRPIAITIPQYAYFNDDGRKLPVVVVQAEEARGKQLVGARDLDGKPIVGFITDFELLGNVSP